MKEILVTKSSSRFVGEFMIFPSIIDAIEEFGVDGIDLDSIRDVPEYEVIIPNGIWMSGLSMTEARKACSDFARQGISAWYLPSGET